MTMLYLAIIVGIVYSTLVISAICALFGINMISSVIKSLMVAKEDSRRAQFRQVMTTANMIAGALSDFSSSLDKRTQLERDKWEREEADIQKAMEKLFAKTTDKTPDGLREIRSGEELDELERARQEMLKEHPEQAVAEV